MTKAEIAMKNKNAQDAVAFCVIGYGVARYLFDDDSFIQINADRSLETGVSQLTEPESKC